MDYEGHSLNFPPDITLHLLGTHIILIMLLVHINDKYKRALGVLMCMKEACGKHSKHIKNSCPLYELNLLIRCVCMRERE